MDFSNQLFAYNNLFFEEQLDVSVARLFQVSELSVMKGGEIPFHRQLCDEITYVVSGSGTVISQNKEETLSPRQIHYIKKDCLHRILANKNENLRFICIGFLLDETKKIYELFEKALDGDKHFTLLDNGNIKILSELLVREFYAWDEYSTDSIKHLMHQIMISLCRIVNGQVGSRQGNLYETNTSNFIVYKTLRFIDREYINLKSVQEIVNALSYSDSYLSHLFKDKLGISLKSYLMQKKVTHAIELLKTSNLSIEEIATYLNFASAHSFRRAFKLHTGQTPSDVKLEKAEIVP